jgi:hypothetical protein
MGGRAPAFKIAECRVLPRLPARSARPIVQAMKRTFQALKPKTAKAKSQPATAERKPAGKQPDAQDLDRAAREKASAAQARKTDGEATGKPAEADKAAKPKEVGGPDGPEPTRYGDWERGGICYDF